jgi:holo-[acyl-carrier protein] synthase
LRILGIGTDLVAMTRIKTIWERFGLAFARRILTLQEQEGLLQSKNPVSFLAKRYAAKEAVAKALGTGFRPHGILLSEIGVRNDDLGRPHLIYFGKTADILQRQGIVESQISLSDERDYAMAFVILLGETD